MTVISISRKFVFRGYIQWRLLKIIWLCPCRRCERTFRNRTRNLSQKLCAMLALRKYIRSISPHSANSARSVSIVLPTSPSRHSVMVIRNSLVATNRTTRIQRTTAQTTMMCSKVRPKIWIGYRFLISNSCRRFIGTFLAFSQPVQFSLPTLLRELYYSPVVLAYFAFHSHTRRW